MNLHILKYLTAKALWSSPLDWISSRKRGDGLNIRRIILFNVIGLLVLLGILYAGYTFYYRGIHYVTTSNAFIEGQEVPIAAQFAGNLSSWNVQNGQTVTAGQKLGQEDTSIELQQVGALAKNVSVSKSIANAAVITSPISGTVMQTSAAVGQIAAPGQALATVVDLNKLYVVANVNEADIRHVNVGDTVDIYVDAYPNLSLKGTVESIGLAANSLFALIPPSDQASGSYTKVTQTIPVKIALSGYSGANLAPGMSTTVRIHRTTS